MNNTNCYISRVELKRIQLSGNPFLDIMTQYQQRGGKAEEFVQALYTVSRDFTMGSSGRGKSDGTPLSTSSGISGK